MDIEKRAEVLASRRKAAKAGITRELTKLGYELRTCGTKNKLLPANAVDSESGGWADPSVKTKPPRWLIRFSQGSTRLKATPAESTTSVSRVGYFNLRTDTVGAVGIRIIPVVQDDKGAFDVLEGYEWFLIFIFDQPLQAGTSGDAFDLDLSSGELSWQERALPLISLCIIGLVDPDENVGGPEVSTPFSEYTDALERMFAQASSVSNANGASV